MGKRSWMREVAMTKCEPEGPLPERAGLVPVRDLGGEGRAQARSAEHGLGWAAIAARGYGALAILAILLSTGTAMGQTKKPAPESKDTVTELEIKLFDELTKRGDALYKEGKWSEAEGEYEKALSLRKTNDVAANLAFAELRQEKWTEAAEHFAFAVRSWPITAGAEKKAFAQKGLEEALGKIVALKVNVNAAGAEVFVDGRRVGISPLEGDVFVTPGTHVVEAKLLGHEDAKEAVEGAAGSSKNVVIELKRKAETGTVMPPVQPVKKRSLVPAIVLGGVAAAGAGAAIGMWVASNNNIDEMRETTKQIRAQGGTCQEGAPMHSLCGSLESSRSLGATLDRLVITSFVVGGLAGAGAAVYLLWPAPREREKGVETKMSIAPVGGGGGGGLFVRGAF